MFEKIKEITISDKTLGDHKVVFIDKELPKYTINHLSIELTSESPKREMLKTMITSLVQQNQNDLSYLINNLTKTIPIKLLRLLISVIEDINDPDPRSFLALRERLGNFCKKKKNNNLTKQPNLKRSNYVGTNNMSENTQEAIINYDINDLIEAVENYNVKRGAEGDELKKSLEESNFILPGKIITQLLITLEPQDLMNELGDKLNYDEKVTLLEIIDNIDVITFDPETTAKLSEFAKILETQIEKNIEVE